MSQPSSLSFDTADSSIAYRTAIAASSSSILTVLGLEADSVASPLGFVVAMALGIVSVCVRSSKSCDNILRDLETLHRYQFVINITIVSVRECLLISLCLKFAISKHLSKRETCQRAITLQAVTTCCFLNNGSENPLRDYFLIGRAVCCLVTPRPVCVASSSHAVLDFPQAR
jgi:hypothetical protein